MGTPELRQKLEAARNTFEYRLENILFEVAEQICNLAENQGMSRTELAQRLAVTPAYITKILNGNPNLTIKSLLKLSDVLGQTLDIRFAPKLGSTQSTRTSLSPARNIPIIEEYTVTRTSKYVVTEQPNEVGNDLALAA